MSALEPAAAPLGSTRVRLDVAPLLALAAPLALLSVALAVAAPALTVQDTWLALVSGREVAQHWLPHADHLTVLAAGHHWTDQQWLGQLVLYGAARLGGIGLAFALCALAIVAAFGLAAHIAYRRGASPVSILLLLGLAVAAGPWGLQFRAQALALPLFTLILWLLERDPRAERRSTLLVLPSLALWANVHGSVVVGVALVLAYAVRTRRLLYLAAPAMVFASPYAPDLPGYYRTMLLDPPYGRYIVEWHRTTPSALTATFFVLATITVAFGIAQRRRLALFDAAALVLTLGVALEAIRGLIWFDLTALALVPALATRTPGSLRFSGRPATIFVAAAAVAIAGALAVTAVRPAHAYETRLPAAVPDLVRASHATVLANDESADWLLWRVPSLRGRLAYDVRFEVLTRAQIRRLVEWRTLSPGWAAALKGSGLVVDDPKHVSRLVASGGWRRVFASRRFAVAERIHRVG